MDQLRANIIRSIRREEARRARVFLALSLFATGASAAGVFVSARAAARALTQSGFLEYVSLLFSDADVLLTYWREFAFSLIETLPLVALTLALIGLAAFLVSLRGVALNLRVSAAS